MGVLQRLPISTPAASFVFVPLLISVSVTTYHHYRFVNLHTPVATSAASNSIDDKMIELFGITEDDAIDRNTDIRFPNG
ncbi:hypothetical protein [Brevibacillus invocatus]|uniref:hypothetical protein n=1 Tax=Brevibacillus invocatus TaxID=173959 RepID=UPI0011CD49CF|nr:hypothetical protein [Brevibacillus invocatus]